VLLACFALATVDCSASSSNAVEEGFAEGATVLLFRPFFVAVLFLGSIETDLLVLEASVHLLAQPTPTSIGALHVLDAVEGKQGQSGTSSVIVPVRCTTRLRVRAVLQCFLEHT
jgi:hypothetical protein